MKLINILKDVAYGNMPKLKKGQQVRVSDKIADDLINRGHAKEEKGEARDVAAVRREKEAKEKGVKKPKVSVTKKKGDESISVTPK